MKIKRYVGKPTIISAMIWDGSDESTKTVLEFMNIDSQNIPEEIQIHLDSIPKVLPVTTLERIIYASPGDYIIKGTLGEHWACKPEAFNNRYEEDNNEKIID